MNVYNFMHIKIYFSSCFDGLPRNYLQLGHLHKPRYATLISNAFDFNINYFNRTCFRSNVRKRSTSHSSRRLRSLLLLFPLSNDSGSILTNQQRRFRRKRRCVGSCNNLQHRVDPGLCVSAPTRGDVEGVESVKVDV